MKFVFTFLDMLSLGILFSNLYYGTDVLLVLGIAYLVFRLVFTLMGIIALTFECIKMEDVTLPMAIRKQKAHLLAQVKLSNYFRDLTTGFIILALGLHDYNALAICTALAAGLSSLMRWGIVRDVKKFVNNLQEKTDG